MEKMLRAETFQDLDQWWHQRCSKMPATDTFTDTRSLLHHNMSCVYLDQSITSHTFIFNFCLCYCHFNGKKYFFIHQLLHTYWTAATVLLQNHSSAKQSTIITHFIVASNMA